MASGSTRPRSTSLATQQGRASAARLTHPIATTSRGTPGSRDPKIERCRIPTNSPPTAGQAAKVPQLNRKSGLNRPTLEKHKGFGSESYAHEELRAEMAAMMAGERLGVGHEPRHGTSYVASWVKALENDPRRSDSRRWMHRRRVIGSAIGNGRWNGSPRLSDRVRARSCISDAPSTS